MVALTLFDHLTRQTLMRPHGPRKAIREALAVVERNLAILTIERKDLLRELVKPARRKYYE
jgi:hypothetical protein